MNQSKKAWIRRLRYLEKMGEMGDLKALSDLGLSLIEGIQDSCGRTIVRRNQKKGFRLLTLASESGEESAFFPLACALDGGWGVQRNEKEALRWYYRAVNNGDSAAANNISTIHRDKRNLELAFKWLYRAWKMGDGDAAEDVGYCYHLGIGVKKNLLLAERAYRNAIRSKCITEWGRQEAMYNLAVIQIEQGTLATIRKAKTLLIRANKDDDYPQAKKLLSSLEKGQKIEPCLCRAKLAGDLAKRWCPLHGKSNR